ncbi:MAG: hypothetical protein KC708_18270 [Anaerolineae bacterium]|nr:hypothetical protein [Anaerolineae bacterium]
MNLEPQSRMGKFWFSLALLATSLVMGLFVVGFTSFYLVPERVMRLSQSDPLVHTLTCIFIYPGAGRILIGGLILLANIIFMYRAVQRRMLFVQRMTTYNFLFLGALFFFVPLAEQLTTKVLFPSPETYDPNYAGYHLAVLPMGVMGALLAIWFQAQWKLTSGRKRKVEELWQL